MTSGPQRFLRIAGELARTLKSGEGDGPRERIRERFREGLFGPWRYRDKQHPLGWDPVFERLHALQARSPDKEDPMSVSAVVWLAFESLPLFPVATRGGRLLTGGFDERSRADGKTAYQVMLEVWDPNPKRRLEKLAEHYPELLIHDEELLLALGTPAL
jgi:hypothetical protein